MGKIHRRLLSGLLSALLALSLLPRAASAAAESDGSISATLRIDYEQKLTELQERNIQAEILYGKQTLGTVDLTKIGTNTLENGLKAEVFHRDRNGGELVSEYDYPGYLDLTVDGLPRGSYTVRLTGSGYVSHSETVEITNYARHIIMGTGDATFTLGDVSGDGKVNEKDRDLLANALASTNRTDIRNYDLNGDEKIDIADLAYINRLIGAEGGAQLLETFALAPAVDAEATKTDLSGCGTQYTGAELSSLFLDDGNTVSFSDKNKGPVVVPLTLKEPVEMEQIEIKTPVGASAVSSGEVTVLDDDGNETTVTFDASVPKDTHAISRTSSSSNIITVDLGTRIAVKKITIRVEKTESGYAAVETIRFLQDIVPENPAPLNSIVKRLSAMPGNERVELTWERLPNVSGYKVTYWLQGSPGSTKKVFTDVTNARITGLDNLKTYVFTVTPVDGDWEGKPSEQITAMPQPSKAPDKTDMVQVAEMDGALRVSWKPAKNAAYFEVHYQEKGGSAWKTVGPLTQSQTVIDNLTNGTTYSIYVLAGNEIGKGPRSDIAEGTPQTVSYQRPEGIPTSGILDSSKIESVRLVDPGNYDAGEYTIAKPFSVQNVIDGDYSTHWTAKNWYSNEHVVVAFKQPVDLSNVIWAPRLDGSYPSWLRAYSVQVWYDGEDLSKAGHQLVPHPNTGGVDNGATGNGSDMHTWPAVQGNPAKSHFAILPMGKTENVKQISVAVEQAAYNRVSLSELLFMEYDAEHDLEGNIDALFSDALHTKLAGGVTQANINTLKTRLENSEERAYCVYPQALADELALAEELLNGKTGSSVILNGLDSLTTSSGSDLQPLGVTAPANQEITIYASGIPAGQTVTVYATQFNSEISGWKGSVGTLQNGRNILKVPALNSKSGVDKGGSLYVTYGGGSAEQISLHIRRAADIPMLDLADWFDQTEGNRKEAIGAYVDELGEYLTENSIVNDTNDHRNVTEIVTPEVLLSLPAKAVNNVLGGTRTEKIDTIYNSILAWEDIMHICKTTHGIDSTYENNPKSARRQNIRCMTMFQGAFMYAAGNHIGIGYSSCGGMALGKPISQLPENASANSLFGWGIAHEIGHNMDMLGKAEITNNIYSLMVQTYDGAQNTLPSRLEKSGKYAAVFTKTAQQYPGASNDVFVQLGMYWQLHLAYDGGDSPMGFYNSFSKAWRAGTYTKEFQNLSYDEKVALTASGTANKNLTEFFTRWGMTLSGEVAEKLKTYPAETRAVWYFTDQSRRDILSKKEPASGTLLAQAQKGNKDNEIVLSIDASGIKGSVQGYEISRNGKSIAFVMTGQNKYIDTIGSGNHRTYEYTVTAYDTQGNKISSVNAGTVRIAYDSVVSPDEYEITRGGDGNVVITLKKEMSVSGLKLNGVIPASGDYRVDIAYSSDGSDQTATALEGTFGSGSNQAVDDENSYVAYFKIPNADKTDTRIWTYDAKSVTITGIPDSVSLNAVQLISYADDDVAFLDGSAAMGLLSEDYRYGDGADDVLKKDTLVIIGSFRGDPTYSTFIVEGEFTGTVMSESGEIAETESVTRPIDGDVYLFATVPAFGDMCDISDGLFLFVPNVQREAELQDMETNGSHCSMTNLLPSRIRVNLCRTDDPNSADSKRLTAQSMWIDCPGGTDLPTVVLTAASEKGEN